jgi:hypothetical protein
MIKSSIEKLSETIGFEIGLSDDVTQSNLLNGFCKGLANSMDDNKLGTQLCYIVDKLDDKSCKILKEIVEFINLKDKK